MTPMTRPSWFRPILRVCCVVLAAASLGGCIIAPPGYYRPHYWRAY